VHTKEKAKKLHYKEEEEGEDLEGVDVVETDYEEGLLLRN
jgi:hypothetical protein